MCNSTMRAPTLGPSSSRTPPRSLPPRKRVRAILNRDLLHIPMVSLPPSVSLSARLLVLSATNVSLSAEHLLAAPQVRPLRLQSPDPILQTTPVKNHVRRNRKECSQKSVNAVSLPYQQCLPHAAYSRPTVAAQSLRPSFSRHTHLPRPGHSSRAIGGHGSPAKFSSASTPSAARSSRATAASSARIAAISR